MLGLTLLGSGACAGSGPSAVSDTFADQASWRRQSGSSGSVGALTLRLPSATVGPFGFTGMWSSALRAWLPHNRFSCPGAIVTPKVARPKWPRTT